MLWLEAETKQAAYAEARRVHTDRVRRALADEVEEASRALEAAGIDPSDVRAVAEAREKRASGVGA